MSKSICLFVLLSQVFLAFIYANQRSNRVNVFMSCSRKPMSDSSSKTTCKFKPSLSSSLRQRQESQYYYNMMYPSIKIQCDHCRRDISHHTKIFSNDRDYCLSCFANATSFPEHFHVINQLNYPLFEEQWTAQEELLLFEGLQKFGFGNWPDIAELIGGSKRPEEVQDHYLTVYLEVPNFLPNAKVLVERSSNGQLIKLHSEKKIRKDIEKVETYQSSRLLAEDHSHTTKNKNNPAQIVGYLPLRRQFEVQYDNDAELLLAELEFNDDDSQKEIQMKFRMIQIYNEKLSQRIRRKNFVIDRGLVDLKQQTKIEKGRTKQQKQIYNMMKIFARFSTPEDHQKLVQGIIKEKQIRERIIYLKQLKAKGYNTLAQAKEIIEEKSHENSNKSKTTSSSLKEQKGLRPRKTKREVVQKKQEGSCYLSSEEQQLCQKFQVTPKQYALIKETMIRQAVKQGVISKKQTRDVFKIERNIVDGIFDFLVSKMEIGVKLQ